MKKALQIICFLLFVCSFTSLTSTAASLPAGNQGQSSTSLLQNPANAATAVKPWKTKIKAGKIARQWKSMKKEFKKGDVSLNLVSFLLGLIAISILVSSLVLFSELVPAIYFITAATSIVGVILGVIGLVNDHPKKWMGIVGIIASGATIAVPVFIFFVLMLAFLFFQ